MSRARAIARRDVPGGGRVLVRMHGLCMPYTRVRARTVGVQCQERVRDDTDGRATGGGCGDFYENASSYVRMDVPECSDASLKSIYSRIVNSVNRTCS